MALKQTVTIPAGTGVASLFPVSGPLAADYDLQGGYLRVVQVRAGRSVATAQIELRTADASGFVCNLAPVQFAHDRACGAAEITTQAYNAIKSLPDYAAAVDC